MSLCFCVFLLDRAIGLERVTMSAETTLEAATAAAEYAKEAATAASDAKHFAAVLVSYADLAATDAVDASTATTEKDAAAAAASAELTLTSLYRYMREHPLALAPKELSPW